MSGLCCTALYQDCSLILFVLCRKVNATESAMVGTVTQTATSTTTYVVQCTNSLIHKPEDACGYGSSSSLPFFSYEAPGTNIHVDRDDISITSHIGYSVTHKVVPVPVSVPLSVPVRFGSVPKMTVLRFFSVLRYGVKAIFS